MTSCRVYDCMWYGSADKIFNHCEKYHREVIREHKNREYFDFKMYEFTQRTAFLLTGPNGIYWFCAGPRYGKKATFGVYCIGNSEPFYYTLKLGTLSDGHADYLGPYKSQKENDFNELIAEVDFDERDLVERREFFQQARLYVGDFDDSDDRYNPTSAEMTWRPEDEALNKLCVEKFTCAVCFEYIRRNARFCENKHFVCLGCFEKLQAHRRLRCPMCRGDYAWDCFSGELERFLRMVKFPEDEGTETAAKGGEKEKENKSSRPKAARVVALT